MNATAEPDTSYSVTRLTVDVPTSFEDFEARYEEAVPPMPWAQVETLVARGAPWEEMISLIEKTAPFGFLIYWTNDVRSVMRLTGR
jgi:hypothetical protein